MPPPRRSRTLRGGRWSPTCGSTSGTRRSRTRPAGRRGPGWTRRASGSRRRWAARRPRSCSPAAARRPTTWPCSAGCATAGASSPRAIEHPAVREPLLAYGGEVAWAPVTADGVVDLGGAGGARPARRRALLRDGGQQRDRRAPAGRGDRGAVRRARRAAPRRRRPGGLGRRRARAAGPHDAGASPRTSWAARRASARSPGRASRDLPAVVPRRRPGARPAARHRERRRRRGAGGGAAPSGRARRRAAERQRARRAPRPAGADGSACPWPPPARRGCPATRCCSPACAATCVVHQLDGAGICVAAGSACAAGSAEPSYVLSAMGIDPPPPAAPCA